MRIGILASGDLGIRTLQNLNSDVYPCFIATDSNSTQIINYAKENNIPLFKGNPRQGRLKDFLNSESYDAIFSLNYIFLVEGDVLEQAKYPINFHGSLLPKYRGRTPHVWAIINNEEYTGVTAHIIDEGCDTGPIVLQEKFRISKDYTGGDILDYFAELYPRMIRELIEKIKSGDVISHPQDLQKATYFGARKPGDGKINWDWQKERIRNWVRAQAKPYPGAFTFLNDHKIIIDKIDHDNFGFDHSEPNGLIISIDPIRVKTPNGVVRLLDIREGQDYIKKGKIFEYEHR